MAKYANRTCHSCGIRKPQPQMYQYETYVQVGKSKSGISTSTVVGSLLGDKKSENVVNRWLFNTNQRNYKRKKTVWLCESCVPAKYKRGFLASAAIFILKAVMYTALLFFLALTVSVLGQM
jgi:hypothetical protein